MTTRAIPIEDGVGWVLEAMADDGPVLDILSRHDAVKLGKKLLVDPGFEEVVVTTPYGRHLVGSEIKNLHF
tara:strand:+ start:10762 stop:10974 length:213 start_codon:yes stop_codon:yes gene_type:complete